MHRKHSGLYPVASPAAAYIEVFRSRCFELLQVGYSRLTPALLHDAEEPAVTGELVKAIRDAMDLGTAPSWMEQFAVRDNPPLNVAGKVGKSRPLVDIEVEMTSRRPRPLFRIEAKWLGKKKVSIGAREGYLGDEGIGCFLTGKYPAEIGHAGMLGYIHSDDEAIWANKIEDQLAKKSAQFRIDKSQGNVWEIDAAQQGSHAFITTHAPKARVQQLKITHLFLSFC